MPRKWSFSLHDRGLVSRLAREMRCSPLLAQILAARGWRTGEEAKRFLAAEMNDLHDPAELPGISEASEQVVEAIQSGRRITIYGDYDVDGVTATSILWHCLKLTGCRVDYYIPNRLEEGYGLNVDAIRSLAEEDASRLVITVDCGISSFTEAALARELGMDLIITDHHTFGEELPPATLVHPRLEEGRYPFPDLCGAGVAFKLAWAICQKLGDGKRASTRMREFLKSAVGLAAMGTVADVVPLVGENRILVKYGLCTLIEKSTPGLAHLLNVAGLQQKKSLTSEDIGFALAPRLNAAGRLGQARLAVELLTTEDAQRAAKLAEYVDQLNKNRQTVERRIFKDAKTMVEEDERLAESAGLVLASDDWHPGVIGIVANRVAQHFERPSILIAMNKEAGVGQGSGRTFAGFDLYSALAACQEHLVGFGGHRAAAGLRVEAGRLDSFREAFAAYAEEHHDVQEADTEIAIDAEVQFSDLTTRAVKELEWLGPFGERHRRPIFAATNVELSDIRTMGNGNRHLSLRIRQQQGAPLRAVAFGKADWADDLAEANGNVSICFAPSINSYRGYENVELQLIDWQAKTATTSSAAPSASSSGT